MNSRRRCPTTAAPTASSGCRTARRRWSIDAKFPLESWNAIRAAEGDAAQKLAAQGFRRDIEIHIRDIAEKYLISGETQDTAFMFVPSESVFAEIHENFEALVQKAHRARVVIVSPSLLMLSIQVVQAILKDARMREQAHLIQGEVARLMDDLGRLDERVRKLQTHFLQTSKDIDDILVSSGKVSRRGAKIEALEFGGDPRTDDAARSRKPCRKGRQGAARSRFQDRAAPAARRRGRRSLTSIASESDSVAAVPAPSDARDRSSPSMMLKWWRSASSTTRVSAPSPVQMLASSAFWRTNSPRSPAPTQHVSLHAVERPQQRRAFGERLGLVELQVGVQREPHHRPEVVDA